MVQSHERSIKPNHFQRLKDFWDDFVQPKSLSGKSSYMGGVENACWYPANNCREKQPNYHSHGQWRTITVPVLLWYRHAIGGQSRQSAKLFLQSSELGLPNPSPAGECAPPPRFWGKGHTRWWERGWESPSSDEGTYTVVLLIYTYFVHLANSKSADAGITFLKAFGIHVLLKPRLKAKCSAVPNRLPDARAPMFVVSMLSHTNYC